MSDTATKILDAAQQLVKERGFNAFSYRDLSELVGIRTASIHYHFPGKAQLATALIERYLLELKNVLGEFDEGVSTHRARLERFIGLFRSTEKAKSICLCGSFAADSSSLPVEVQKKVREYMKVSQTWVTEAIRAGVASGEFSFDGDPSDPALSLIASLQGGLLLARTGQKYPVIKTLERSFFQFLAPG